MSYCPLTFVNEFVNSEPERINQWMAFPETYSYNISLNGMLMHI